MNFLLHVRKMAIAALCVAAGSASADAINVTFDGGSGPALGALPGGADARTPGNGNQWYVPDNAATSGVVQAGIGRGGTNGLVVGNRSNGNDGVVDNVKTGQLAQAAGENSSGAVNHIFDSSFWFRTASGTAVNGFEFKTESWGTDRTTWLHFATGASGISVESGGYGVGGTDTGDILATELTWGEWYHVITHVEFVDGGGANDSVTFSIYDNTNMLVGTLADKTWEEGQRTYGFNGGQQVAVNAIGFQSRYSTGGLNGSVYIDDVTWSSSVDAAAVPEPSALALVVLAGGLAAGATRRRRV